MSEPEFPAGNISYRAGTQPPVSSSGNYVLKKIPRGCEVFLKVEPTGLEPVTSRV